MNLFFIGFKIFHPISLHFTSVLIVLKYSSFTTMISNRCVFKCFPSNVCNFLLSIAEKSPSYFPKHHDYEAVDYYLSLLEENCCLSPFPLTLKEKQISLNYLTQLILFTISTIMKIITHIQNSPKFSAKIIYCRFLLPTEFSTIWNWNYVFLNRSESSTKPFNHLSWYYQAFAKCEVKVHAATVWKGST